MEIKDRSLSYLWFTVGYRLHTPRVCTEDAYIGLILFSQREEWEEDSEPGFVSELEESEVDSDEAEATAGAEKKAEETKGEAAIEIDRHMAQF